MPPASIQSALAKMYKDVFMGGDLTNLSERPTPTGKKIKSSETLVGSSKIYPIHYGLGWGIHPTLNSTTPSAKATKFNKWTIPCDAPSTLYARLTIDNLSAMRSRSDAAAYMELKKKEIMDTIANMNMMRYGSQPWSDGAGDIAQVLAVTGSNPATSFTIKNYEDAIKFDGTGKQVIVFNPTRTGSAGTIKASTWQVDKVRRYDPTTGIATITVTRLTGAGAGVDPAANDYVYVDGTYDAGFKGIPAWNPTAVPTPTLFYGVDRTEEEEYLAGWRGSWEGTIADSLERLGALMGAHFMPDTAAFLSPNRYLQLTKEVQGKNTFFEDKQASLEWGTETMSLVTPGGKIPVISDPYCPPTACWVGSLSQFEYMTTGPMIHMADEDVSGLRLVDSDALEYRIRSAALLRCDKPSKWGNFLIQQS